MAVRKKTTQQAKGTSINSKSTTKKKHESDIVKDNVSTQRRHLAPAMTVKVVNEMYRIISKAHEGIFFPNPYVLLYQILSLDEDTIGCYDLIQSDVLNDQFSSFKKSLYKLMEAAIENVRYFNWIQDADDDCETDSDEPTTVDGISESTLGNWMSEVKKQFRIV